jgi:Tol biopolymer transport system component
LLALGAGVVGLGGVAGASGTGTAGLTYVTSTNTLRPKVWAASANGSNARKLGVGDQPQLSPNGKLIAVASAGPHGAGIVIFNAGGGTFGKFLGGLTFAATPVAWSPDSRYLAVEAFDPDSTGIGKSALFVIDTSTRHATTIAHGIVNGASFSGDSGTVYYGLYKSAAFNGPVNIYSVDPAGATTPVQVTTDNRSLNPLWTARGIVFDHEKLRKEAPEYQIFLLHGGHATQITNIKVDQLSEGLVPIAASADGTRLAAEYGGQDNSEGWAVNLVTHKARELANRTNGLVDAGISRNGKTLLVDLGIFGGDPASRGKVATIPFGGGRPTVLVAHGNEPTWNR